MKWRKIKSAPKDGTRVILCRATDNTEIIGIGSFGACREQQDGYRVNRGEPCWREDDMMKKFPEPTHWMPLPCAPKEA